MFFGIPVVLVMFMTVGLVAFVALLVGEITRDFRA